MQAVARERRRVVRDFIAQAWSGAAASSRELKEHGTLAQHHITVSCNLVPGAGVMRIRARPIGMTQFVAISDAFEAIDMSVDGTFSGIASGFYDAYRAEMTVAFDDPAARADVRVASCGTALSPGTDMARDGDRRIARTLLLEAWDGSGTKGKLIPDSEGMTHHHLAIACSSAPAAGTLQVRGRPLGGSRFVRISAELEAIDLTATGSYSGLIVGLFDALSFFVSGLSAGVTITARAASTGDDLLNTGWLVSQLGALGTMAYQDADAVAITGGTATLDTLTVNGESSFLDTLDITLPASGINLRLGKTTTNPQFVFARAGVDVWGMYAPSDDTFTVRDWDGLLDVLTIKPTGIGLRGSPSGFANYHDFTITGGSSGSTYEHRNSAGVRKAFWVYNASGNMTLGTVSGAGPIILQPGGSTRLTLDEAGRVYGTALHNNTSGITGTTNQFIGSGTWTPTTSGLSNVSSAVAEAGQWIRVGNVVVCSGRVNPTVTAVGNAVFRISLPVTSNITTPANCAGTAAVTLHNGAMQAVAILGDTASDTAEFSWTSSDSGSMIMMFTITYLIQ